MSDQKEKLSLLSQMIAMILSDDAVHPGEIEFLRALAYKMGISSADLEDMLQHPPAITRFPEAEADRIVQFHTLVLLMNADGSAEFSEMEILRRMGLRMGLSPFAIDRVLNVIPQYPNGIVPPEVVIDIFKTYYN